MGDNTYSGDTLIQAAPANNTNNILRMGVYGTSSGVGTLASGGFGQLPGTGGLRLSAGNDGISKNVAFDLNGSSQTVAYLKSAFDSGTRKVFLKNGTLTINTPANQTSGDYTGTLEGRGIINVLATQDTGGNGLGWRLTGNSNAVFEGSFNVLGGTVSLDGNGGTLGDTVDVMVGAAGHLNLRQSDTIGSLAGSGTVTVGTGLALTLTASPGAGALDDGWSGTITGLGRLNMAAGASLRLTTPQTHTGGTTLNSGAALYLDYGTTAKELLRTSAVLNLNGGRLVTMGSAGQTINNVNVGSGATIVSQPLGSTSILNIQTINRDITTLPLGSLPGQGGGVLEVHGNNLATATTAATGGILGGYATHHSLGAGNATVVSWAVPNGAGNAITGLADNLYSTTFTSGAHTEVTAFNTQNAVSATEIGSLRFNSQNTVNLSLSGAKTLIQSGGILLTPNVGSNNVSINAGSAGATLTGGAGNNGGSFRVLNELIVHQHNTRGTLTLNLPVADNAGSTRLTKTGQGKLVLTRTNTYSGQTSILGGVLELANAADNQTRGALGDSLGVFAVQNYGYLSFNRSNTGGILDEYTLNNDITGTGIVRKLNDSKVILRGGSSSYTGPTQVRAGVLAVASPNALGSVDGYTFVNAGATLELRATTVPETIILYGGRLASEAGGSGVSGQLRIFGDSSIRVPTRSASMNLSGAVVLEGGKTLTVVGTPNAQNTNWTDGGVLTLSNSMNQIGQVRLERFTSLQIGNNSAGSIGRSAAISMGADTRVITNTNNSQMVFGATMSGQGGYTHVRNIVYLTSDNTYTGSTIIGGNGTIGEANWHADLRVGGDTYTGSLGTGPITIQAPTISGGGTSLLRYILNRSQTLSNTINLNPAVQSDLGTSVRNAHFVRYGLGSMTLAGTINAGSHSDGVGTQRAIIQTDGGGMLTISGVINNGEQNSVNLVNNGTMIFANENANLVQNIWGILSGGGLTSFSSKGTIVLKAENTFNAANYIRSGKVIVDNSSGLGIHDDNDFYISSTGRLQFNYNETVGALSTQRGAVITVNNSTLTVDDGGTFGHFGEFNGSGSLNLTGNGTGWYGLFGKNTLANDTTIGSSSQLITVRVNDLSNGGVADSLGMGNSITLGVANGTGEARLEYIGPGQATNRNININNGNNGIVRIAGSGTGALILNGDISITSTGNKTLMLHGQTVGNQINGAITEGGNVMALTVNPNAGNNDMYGHGRWILTSPNNDFSGNVTVNLGVLELAGNLFDGAATNSVLGDLTATRTIDLGTNNFDGRKFDSFSGGDNLGAGGGLTSTGAILFNDPNAGTAVLGTNISFRQSFDSTTNPGNGELINNGVKTLEIRGSFTSGANGSRNWILDGTNTGVNVITGSISETSTSGSVGVLKEGSGRWRLAGTNTYEGTTTVARGILEITGGAAIHDNGLISLSNVGSDASSLESATLRVLSSETIGGLTGAVGSQVELENGATLTMRSSTQTYNGIISGVGNIVRTNNDGSVRESTMTNKSSYTGTTTVTTNGSSFVANRINVLFLADGGADSGIGASSSAAANLILNTNTAGGGLRWIGGADQSTDRLFTLGSGSAAGSIWGDGQTFGDSASKLHFTNTGDIAFLSSNTNQTLLLRGSTVTENRFDPRLTNNGTGVTSLTKADAGMWLLTNANTHSGTTTISGGTLAITHGSALGTGSVNVTGGAGTGLQLRGGLTVANNLSNSAADGGLAAFSGANTWTGTVTLGGGNANWRLGAAEGASLNFTNVINGSVGTSRILKYDRGTITMSGSNTFTGIMALAGGTLRLNYNTADGGTDTSKLANGSALEFGFMEGAAGITTGLGADDNVGNQSNQPAFAGGTLILDGGSHLEVVASTRLNNGASQLISTGNAKLQMGTITRNAANGINEYGTIDFSANGIATTNTLSTAGGVMAFTGTSTASSAYATVGQTTWAGTATSGTNIAINGITNYSNNLFATNTNTDITSASVNVAANSVTHTLRFNSTGNSTLNLAGVLNLETGGILVTKNVTGNVVIGGAGQLRRSTNTANLDTVIHHYGSGLLSINVPIVNNTATQALTKTGTGTLVLNAANSFTGRVNLQQGILQVGDGSAAFTSARLGNGSNPLSMANGALLRINVANPALEYTVGSINGGGLLHLAESNTSIFTLASDSANWVGDILVEGGTLRVRANNNALGSIRGTTTIGSSGTLNIHGSTQNFPERITLLQGAKVTVTNNGGTNSNATISGVMTLQNTTTAGAVFDVGNNQALTLSAMVRTTKGLTKNGNGVLTLSANQMQEFLPGAAAGSTTPNANPALLGQVIVTGGELRLGNPRALGGTGVGNETIVQSGASLDLRAQSLNYADDPTASREIIRIAGAGYNGLGALKNSSSLGVASHIVFDADATLSGGGFANSSRLVLAGFDTNANTGSNFDGNITRNQAVIDGRNAKLTIVGNATSNDANGVGVTLRDPNFISPLHSINVREGTLRIDKEAGSGSNFQALSAANVVNGITIGYAGATLGDQTNASLGVGPNVGARLNFYRNWDTVHTVAITMDGDLAKANGGANYIDNGNDSTTPNTRTYLGGSIVLKGDADRNFFHVDGSAIQQTLGEYGNMRATIASKLVINGAITGTGGFTKTGYRELRLTNNNTFTGDLNVLRFGSAAVRWQDNLVTINGVDYQTYGDAEGLPEWGLTLTGDNGRVSGTGTINLQRRGLIVLDNTRTLDATSNGPGTQPNGRSNAVLGGNNDDRINNAASINFNHGWLKILGGTANNNESLATAGGAKLNVLSGTNIIDLQPTNGSGKAMLLTIGEISRSAGAVLQINNLDSNSTFGTAETGEVVRVKLNSQGNLVQVGASSSATDRGVIIGLFGGIMPHQYLNDVRDLGFNNAGTSDYLNQGRNQQFISATHFMTYDPVSQVLRPLDDSEYFIPGDSMIDNTAGGAAGKNVNLTDNYTVMRESTSVNTLRFGPVADNLGNNVANRVNNTTALTSLLDGQNVQLYVDGTLTIDSGMISSAYFTTGNSSSLATYIMGGTLNFGNREAIINNMNATMRSSDGALPTGNLEIRSSIAGTGGLLKTGIAQVVLDGVNTYSGTTTVSNGTLFLRNGRQALGVGGPGNGVVIEGNGSLNSGNGIRVGSPDAYEDILVKALQGNSYVMRVDNDLTNWYSNLIVDNVDVAGQVLFTPLIRTDNTASAIIHGNIYGGATAVSNDVLAIDSRIIQVESAGNNAYIFRGQFGDKGDANGKAIPIADPISTLPTLAGLRTNENEVLRVTLAASAETIYTLEQQYNAVGRLTLQQGTMIIDYDPAAPGRDGTGFWTDSAMARIPNGFSNGSFALNGNTGQSGFTMGTTSNSTSALFLTRPDQVFNMGTWTVGSTAAKWIGGLNSSGTVTYGTTSTTNNQLSIGGTALRFYSMAGGTVVFDHRITGSPGTAPNNLGIIKVGRGTVVLQNTTNASASDSNFEIAGGTLILDHDVRNVARVGAANAIFSGGVLHAKSNTAAASTANYAVTSGTNNILQLNVGTTEVIAEGVGTRTMTVNIGNTNTNSNRANIQRATGAAINFVEAITGNGNGVITLNFNNFTNALQKNRVVSWATYGNTGRQALDFAMVDAGASNRVKVFNRAAGEYLNNAMAWGNGMDVSEAGGAGFFGTMTASRALNTMRFDTMADSLVTIGSGQTLSLIGDGIAGGILVSSNTGAANKTISGGSLTGFRQTYTGGTTSGSTVITNVSNVANLEVGMPVTGSGIPSGAYITAINGNSVTLSASATATNAAVSLTTQTPELMIHQYGKGTLTIGSTITGSQALTITGPSTTSPEHFGTTGVVKLTGNNTYTGPTHVAGAVLEVSNTSALGVNPTSVSNAHLTLNGGTFRWTGETGNLGNRGITLRGDGGVIDVVKATGNLIVGNALSGTKASVVSDELYSGDLVKTGAGGLTFLGNNASFQGLMDVREGSLTLMADNGNANAGTTTLLGSNRSWADGTIMRTGTNMHVFLGNGNNGGDWNIEEYITFEGNNRFTYGGLLDISANLAVDVLTGQYNLGNRRPLNLNGIMDIQGTTTFDVTTNGILRFGSVGNGSGSGYLKGSGDIIKDGAGALHFRSNIPDWTGNMVILQGTVMASNQADVFGTGYNSGKTITLGSPDRQGVAELLIHNVESIHASIFEVNHDIEVVYNPAQTKRLGMGETTANNNASTNGNSLNYNGDITLNDSLILLIRDINNAVGGEQGTVNFNGSFKDGALTSGNMLIQTDDTNTTANDLVSNRNFGYAVFSGDNSGWTGDITINNNLVYNHDTTAVLRLQHSKALTAANDVTMNFNSILQAGGQNVTIGNLYTVGGDGAFFGDAGSMSSALNGSSEIIENAARTPSILTITQTTPNTYEANWDAFFRDGTLNSQFFAPGSNILQPSAYLGLTKAGDGWATLTLDNDYTGPTRVAGGILQVGRNGVGDTGKISPRGITATTVMNGATIAGSGIVQGKLTILAGGRLSTGDSAGAAMGTLTVSGDALFASGASALMQVRDPSYNNPGALPVTDPNYRFWRDAVVTDQFSSALNDLVSSSQHDMLNALGTINWAPGTKITLETEGYTPRAGDIIRLFKGTSFYGSVNVGPELRSGGETDIANLDLILFALGGNLLWDVSLFNSHGILMVVEADAVTQSVALPVITQAPQASHDQEEVLDPGTEVTLTVVATTEGDPLKLRYQWLLNGIPLTDPESRKATFTFQANYNSKGEYRVAVTNEGGTILSAEEDSITVLVDDSPQITLQPVSVAVAPGATHQFQVAVGGPRENMTFQWYKNDAAIPGAESETLVLRDIVEADEGSYYLVAINEGGTATTQSAYLDVYDKITTATVTYSPTPTFVTQKVRFEVTHDGEGTMAYQWLRDGSPIAGATQRFYEINGVTMNDAKDYSVRIVSPANPASNPFVSPQVELLIYDAQPVILESPVSRIIKTGDPLDMKVVVRGLPDMLYTWKRNNAAVPNGLVPDISKANATLLDGGSYIVEIANPIGKLTTAKAPYTPAEVVVVDGEMSYISAAQLGAATLNARIGASPKVALTYDWRRSKIEYITGPGPDEELGTEDDTVEEVEVLEALPGGKGSRFTGINTKTLKIAKVDKETDEGVYVCLISGLGVTEPVRGSEYELRVFSTAPAFDGPLVFDDAVIGRDYSFQVPVKRDDLTAWPDKITIAGLPPGLKMDPLTGLITGKPTATKAGGYKVTVTLANKIGKVALAATLLVNDLNQTVPGAWVGPVERHATLNGNLGGRVDLTVTTKATFSGKLLLGASTLSFTGTLDMNGSAPAGLAFVKRTGKPTPAPLRFEFTLNPANNTIASGSISDGSSTVSFGGWRQRFSKTAPATSFKGYYTLAIGLPDNSPLIVAAGTPNVPLGSGYATFTVADDGKLNMVGKMPDGETLTNATFLGPNGEIAVYQYMYKAIKPQGGSLLGQFDIDDSEATPSSNINNFITGSATWVRPASTKATDRTFKAGFGIAGAPVSAPLGVVAVGGRYDAPAADKLVFGLDIPAVPVNNTRIEFINGGDLGYTYTVQGFTLTSDQPDWNFALIKGSKATVLKENVAANVTKTAVSVVAKTGLLSGGFTTQDTNPRIPLTPPVVTRAVKFAGVLINERQDDGQGGIELKQVGVGFFLLPQLPNGSQGTTDKTSPYYSGQFIYAPLE